KFDVPLLEVALRLPEVGYVCAMGSRRTHDDRLDRLREAGLTEAEWARLSSPIGLDLGARTPEETAVSIAAEIVARRWGGTGEPLARTGRRVHHDPHRVAQTDPRVAQKWMTRRPIFFGLRHSRDLRARLRGGCGRPGARGRRSARGPSGGSGPRRSLPSLA
ncbi:MAG: XdhC family protein, partial [Aeromicrobium sp.]